jgi:hypothetical protein
MLYLQPESGHHTRRILDRAHGAVIFNTSVVRHDTESLIALAHNGESHCILFTKTERRNFMGNEIASSFTSVQVR